MEPTTTETTITTNSRQRTMKPKQMQAEGGEALRMRIRKSDLKRLEEIKAFYWEKFSLYPSNSVLIRRLIEGHFRFISSLSETPEALQDERRKLMAAVLDD